MDQTTLVREKIEGGEKLIRKLVERGFELLAGLWAKVEHDSQTYFYLVTPLVDTIGPIEAYREVSLAQIELEKEGLHWMEQIEQFTAKLISPRHPLAQEVLSRYRQYPNTAVFPAHGLWYSSSVSDGGFLYPPSLFQPVSAATP